MILKAQEKEKKKNTFKTFHTIDNIKKASIEELAQVESMNIKVAEDLYNHLERQGGN